MKSFHEAYRLLGQDKRTKRYSICYYNIAAQLWSQFVFFVIEYEKSFTLSFINHIYLQISALYSPIMYIKYRLFTKPKHERLTLRQWRENRYLLAWTHKLWSQTVFFVIGHFLASWVLFTRYTHFAVYFKYRLALFYALTKLDNHPAIEWREGNG